MADVFVLSTIILCFVILFFRETIVNYVKSGFDIQTNKETSLHEYKLRRYDEFIEKIEAMLAGDDEERKKAKKTLNTLWGKILISAPDNVIIKLLEETKKQEGQKKREFGKKERNKLYLTMRKELHPNTAIKEKEIEHIYFDI